MKNIIVILSIFISSFAFNQSNPPTVLTLDGEIWGADTVKCMIFYLDQDVSEWIFVEEYTFVGEYDIDFTMKGAVYGLWFFDPNTTKTKTVHVVVDNVAKYRMDLNYDDDPYKEFLLVDKINTNNEYVLAVLR